MSTNHYESDGAELHAARLTAYALGQLDEREKAEVEAELEASPSSREAVEAARAAAGLVREADRHQPPPAPSAALREAVARCLEEPHATVAPALPARPLRDSRRLRAILAASLLIASLGGLLTWLGSRSGRHEDLAMSPAESETVDPSRSETARAAPAMPMEMPAEPTFERSTRPGRSQMVADVSQNAAKRDSGVPASTGAIVVATPGQAGGAMAPWTKNEPASTVPVAGPSSVPNEPSSSPAKQPAPSPAYLTPPSDSGVARAPVRPEGKPHVIPAPRYYGASGDKASLSASDRETTLQTLDDARHKPGAKAKKAKSLAGAAGGKSGYTNVPPEQPPRLQKPRADSDSERPPEEELGQPAPGTEEYSRIVENDFEAVAREPLSTLSVDVDTASYASVRRFLSEGRLPPPDAVRIEEMVNYFPYRYPNAEGKDPFSVSMEVAQCPWNEGHRLLRVGLKGREIDRRQRGPCNLVFLLDVSGSMSDENKLPLVKQGMKMLVSQLTEDDRVAIVTYASSAAVRLESVNGTRKEEILRVIDSLSADGMTNGSEGIQLAYEQARRHLVKKGTNRVVLATDGDLNVGVTRDDDLVRLVRQEAKSGVFLTVLGVGSGNLKDSKLEKLADRCNGKYFYVDSTREAHKVLVEQMSGSLVTIAKDVKIRIEFNPREVVAYRLIGYENRRLAAPDFENDRKDAGEIGAGHTVTALYELVPRSRNADEEERALKYQRVPEHRLTEAADSGELLTLALRYKEPDARESKLLEFSLKDAGKRFGQSSADFQFASAVASFGMVLRGSAYRGNATLASVEEIAASALADDPGGHRAEFLDLVRKAERIRAAR